MTCRICGATVDKGYHVCVGCRLDLQKFLEEDNKRKGRMSAKDIARELKGRMSAKDIARELIRENAT